MIESIVPMPQTSSLFFAHALVFLETFVSFALEHPRSTVTLKTARTRCDWTLAKLTLTFFDTFALA